MLWVLLACADGGYTSGASEPITVNGAEFIEGDLPSNDGRTIPEVLYSASVGYVVTQGMGNIKYSGLASTDAYSVAVSFPTVGTGYWVVPAGAPDVTQESNLSFSMVLNFSEEVPPGLQSLDFVAFDADGHVGPLYESTICVLSDISDGSFAECDPETTPQNAIISLSWDTPVDLDLVAVTPEGKVVSWKNPTTLTGDGTLDGDAIDDPTTGELSRDSNANCVIDGIQVESLIFPGEPPAGDYAFYASLPYNCGESYVNWDLSLYRRTDADDGTHPVEQTDLAKGELLGSQADGGVSYGTYITTLTLP